MKMQLKAWTIFIVSGVCFAAESTDAEIVKDLDFFMSIDMVGNDAAMDENDGDFLDEDSSGETTSPNAAKGVSK